MHNYRRAFAVLGLTITVASAMSAPRMVTSELPDSLPIEVGANTEVAQITGGHIPANFGASAEDPSLHQRSHAYDSAYEFSFQDGWETIPVTDLSYKYDDMTNTRSETIARKRQRSDVKRTVGVGLGGTVNHALGETWNSVQGVGKAQGVAITW